METLEAQAVSESPWKNRDAGSSPLPCKLRLWGWRVSCFLALPDDMGRAVPGRLGGKASTERISGTEGHTDEKSQRSFTGGRTRLRV